MLVSHGFNIVLSMSLYIHKCMWKSHFGSVNSPITSGFDDSKDVGIFWIENNTLECALYMS